MAAYHKVEVALNKQSITVGSPSPQTVNVVVPNRGPKGDTGDTGPTGPANSLSIGTVTTGAAGSSASATITGTAPDQTLDLAIPRGDKGEKGDTGDTGAPGATGPANTLTIGTVTTGAEGDPAAATITGDAPNQTLSLTLPVGATGATGPQGPAGEQTTDASLLTSGTLADARLSSNVPLKDAANTFSANQTLNGTNNVATNQTAASGSSLMTRDLVDARIFQPPAGPRYFAFNEVSSRGTFTANSGTASTNQVFSNTADASVGTMRYWDMAGIFSPDIRVVDWQNPYTFGGNMIVGSDAALGNNHTQYLLFGAPSYNSGQPTTRCVGFRITGTTIYALAHNGTTYSEPFSLSSAVTAWSPMRLWVTTNGSGGASWYKDGTLIGTATSGAPSTQSSIFQNAIVFSSQSNAVTTHGVRFQSYFFWIYKP